MDMIKKESYIKELKRKFKFNKKTLNLFIEQIKKHFENCYICNLDGKVIME